MTEKIGPDGFTHVNADDYPVVHHVANFMGGAAAGVATHILDKVSPPMRDMVLGSVTLKLALGILMAGDASLPEDRVRTMIDFYIKHIQNDILEMERERAGGVQ